MGFSTAIDTLLDRTIAFGYGHPGLRVRRRLPGWPADPPRLDGKVVLITGAASGLGLASAVGYVRLGADVRALARTERRAREAVDAIRRQTGDGEVTPVACDIASLDDLRRFIAAFTAGEERLDVLVNNAGVMPAEREESPDGVELTFATNVLAPWMLIDGLQDVLARGEPGRVINVSSGGMYGQSVPADDLETADPGDYGPKTVYARTKRGLMVITEEWAERLHDRGVVVHAMHPGWADTEGVRNWMPVFRTVTRAIIRSPEQGADTIVWMGGAPEVAASTGLFWHDRLPRPTHYRIGASPDDEAARSAVWDHCARLDGAREAT